MSWGTIAASTMACILAILFLFSCLQYQVLSSEYTNLYDSYRDLRGKYDGLQEDYQKAVSRLKAISEENSRLRKNYNKLVESYEKLRLQCGELEQISDRILTPSDKIPDMLKQARPEMVKDIVHGELGLRREAPPETKAKKVLEWLMLNLEYLDDDFHQYLADGVLESYQDFLSLPNETLARGGGDCEDLATLTYTMLKTVLKKGEQIYIVQIGGSGVWHVGVIYRVGDKIMILDPAGGYVTDAKIVLQMLVKKGFEEYKILLSPLAIRREGRERLMENGLANLVYMKSPGVEGEPYRFLEVEEATTLWLEHWRRKMINPSIRMVANDTFVKIFASTQEFINWMERTA